jgi:ATP-dependent exoDNAse (exonuclease V) beta subunit
LWFSKIEWLENGMPTADQLRAMAENGRAELPDEVWPQLDDHLAVFRSYLEKPEVAAVLRRSAYSGPQQPGFPAALAPFWGTTLKPEKVRRELRFLVPDQDKLWDGSFDRIVWLADNQGTVAVDIIDYKTDNIAPGDMPAIEQRTDHYRPQMEIYRSAAARLAGIAQDRVAARLVFTNAGCVREI